MAHLIDEPAAFLRDDAVVRVAGPDRVAYLHSLLSQDLESLRPGDVRDFLHLDARGEHLAAGTLVVHAEVLYLIVPAEIGTAFAEALDRFRFMMQVEVTNLAGTWAVASLRGDEPVEAPGARSQPGTAAPHGPGLVVRDRGGGVDLLGPRGWVTDRLDELELPAATAADWERWRISSGRPGWGTEITAGRRSQELGLLPTHVHLRKGCYPGQESIAKINNLGRPRRALAVVRSDAVLEPGQPVGEGRRPGEITSAAATEDGSIALALVPLDADGVLPEQTVAGDAAITVLRRVGEGVPQPGAQPSPGERAPAARPTR